MVTLQAIEHALPSCAASYSLLRAIYGENEWLMKPISGNPFPAAPLLDRIVIAELLEHLPRPDDMLRTLVRSAQRETLVVASIAINIEAPDHIYLFRDLEEVRALLQDCGLKVQDELDLPLKINVPLRKPAYQVAILCRPAA
jgi:hypothetical protein